MSEHIKNAAEARRARQEVWRRLDSYYAAIRERAETGAEDLFERALRAYASRGGEPEHSGYPTAR